MTRDRLRQSVFLTAALGASAPLLAQSVPAAPGQTTGATTGNTTGNGIGLRSLDPGFDDVGPLGQSFQLQRINTRLDTNFSRVYGLEDGSGRYVRRDGAINAVFPRSDYATISTRNGARTVPLVPAGTIFYIGDPAAQSTPDQIPAPARPNMVGEGPLAQSAGSERLSRLTNRITWVPGAGPPADETFEPSDETPSFRREALPDAFRRDVMVNEPYRRQRLNDMTRRAVLELIEQGRTLEPNERSYRPAETEGEPAQDHMEELSRALELDG